MENVKKEAFYSFMSGKNTYYLYFHRFLYISIAVKVKTAEVREGLKKTNIFFIHILWISV